MTSEAGFSLRLTAPFCPVRLPGLICLAAWCRPRSASGALVREHGLRHALTAARDALLLRLERRADREWDRRHGIDTCGVTHLGHLEVEGENLA